MTIARVFVDDTGKFGNPVGIVVDEALDFDEISRQKMTRESGLSEVVFIDNLARGIIHIFSPVREIPFAGHAAVGAAWFINQERKQPLSTLLGIEGPIETWEEDDLTWVSCPQAILPPWELVHHASAKEVENLSATKILSDAHALHWAWINESKGLVHARTFAPAWGITEDEANGSGSMKLASVLQRQLKIIHGQGSVILAKPAEGNMIQVGGRVCIA